MPPIFPPDYNNRHNVTERFLQEHGLWEKTEFRQNIPHVEIDPASWSSSANNPARIFHRGLRQDRVETYSDYWNRGVTFPPIVVLPVDPSKKTGYKYEIATGNQRMAALMLSAIPKFIDAYIVNEYRPEVRKWLMLRLNTLEGMHPTQIELIQWAVSYYNDDYRGTVKDLANSLLIREELLSDYIRYDGIARRARQSGISNWEEAIKGHVSREAVISLDKIPLPQTSIFDAAAAAIVGAAELLDSGQSISSEVKEMTENISKAVNVREQRRFINQFASNIKESVEREKDKLRKLTKPTKTPKEISEYRQAIRTLIRLVKSPRDVIVAMHPKDRSESHEAGEALRIFHRLYDLENT